MLLVSLLRILFDVGILYLFVSMANPRQDSHNPFCLLLQYTSFPFAARLFPDFVNMGAISVHNKPKIDFDKLFAKEHVQDPSSELKAILPLRPEVMELVKNVTTIDDFMTMRDSTFKFFLNISILVFMYFGTLLTWAAVRKAHTTNERVEMKKMQKTYSMLLYFCVSTVWMFCNTESLKRMWRDMMYNRYGSVFMINVLAWSFLLVTIRVTFHCFQLIPPKTSSQCNFLQNYLAILNISVWYSFVALYFAYNFFQPTLFFSESFPLPFDENLLVSLLFLFSFAFAPPYRYRLPIPTFMLLKNLDGNLPEMQEKFRKREKAAKKQGEQEKKEYIGLKMDGMQGTIEPPPAYEAA